MTFVNQSIKIDRSRPRETERLAGKLPLPYGMGDDSETEGKPRAKPEEKMRSFLYYMKANRGITKAGARSIGVSEFKKMLKRVHDIGIETKQIKQNGRDRWIFADPNIVIRDYLESGKSEDDQRSEV